MIVKALLDIQARYGYLPPEELEFLALRARVPLYRVQEITTFFPHFRHKEPPKVTVHVCQSMTCHLRGAQAMLEPIKQMARQLPEGSLEVHGVSCLGRCDRAPVALLGQHTHEGNGTGHHEMLFCELGKKHHLPALVGEAMGGRQLNPDHDEIHKERPDWEIDPYHPRHGLKLEPYAAVQAFLDGDLLMAHRQEMLEKERKKTREKLIKAQQEVPPDAELDDSNIPSVGDGLINQIELAGLVGMGGAAASTFRKWLDVRSARGDTRYIICNADESEPGTFKDRELMLRTPHLLIEGMLIAGLTVGASRGYIYTRHEYPEQIAACDAEIKRATEIVPEAMKRCPIETFTSPGLYICGEESALIEVIEGKRAQPRNQPPSIRDKGLFEEPTVVNNVETYSWVPAILLRRPSDWYRNKPLRFFSISGDVNKPGVFEVGFDTTLGELIEKAGGIADGMEFYASATSGPSGGFVPAVFTREQTTALLGQLDRALKPPYDLGGRDPSCIVHKWRQTLKGERLERLHLSDMPLHVQLYRGVGLSLGAAIIIYGKKKGGQPPVMLDHALNTLEFFEKESCGKCVPCRLGAQQLVHFARELHSNRMSLPTVEPHVRTLSGVMKVASICGLGRAASVPFATWLDYFQDEKKAGRRMETDK